jgi:ribosome biogenesis GTPase A
MVLQDIAVARGAIRKGGEPDVSKAAALLMDDFRAGRLGRVTLELPEV